MEVGVLSMRYAKAMIEYAQEKGVEDRLYNEFFTLSHSFRVQPGLREVLDNPVVSVKDKLALIWLPMVTVNPAESLSVSSHWFCETRAKAIRSSSA